MASEAEKKLVNWLEQRHAEVMDFEKAALALMQAGDIDGYRKNMREKAESLANMAADAEPVLADLKPGIGAAIKSKLANFSTSALTALELNSVFYMSALLYPDDHKKGEPDNLELYIHDLKAKFTAAS